jgi:sugar phosphate isomerase/epimerase
MQLGMVTYMWGAEWDLPTLITNCTRSGFQGIELRTTHKHGVEVTLSPDERNRVRKQFDDSPVRFVGPGTACEFQSPDPAVVRQNIDLTKKFIVLSHDLGGSGVKVRPNGLVKVEEPARTIDRIGKALHECGEFAAGYGQEVRVEVHGTGTSDLAVMKQIIDAAGHDSVLVCWNSNAGETVDGSVAKSFNRVRTKLGRTVHIHDLYDDYPYRELFALLRKQDYDGYCLSESPTTADPLRVMRYYRLLFDELNRE